ncbi:MAG TPA: addiction module protein [Xanthobacteraceae bacterium]|jgi:putative addiction module component (TIGR02574 family)
MSNQAKTLIEQARALPPQDRIALVEDVLDSLDRADPDIDQLWAREASERLAAYRRGEIAAKDPGNLVAKYRP